MWVNKVILAIGAVSFLGACASQNAGTATGNPADSAALKNTIAAALSAVEDDAPALEYVVPERNVAFRVVDFTALDGWGQDDHAEALSAFQISCDRLRKLKTTTVLGGLASEIEDWRPSCDAADAVAPATAQTFFEFAFTPVKIAPEDTALITSYYEPELEASRVRTAKFKFPLLAKPKELVSAGGKWGTRKGGSIQPYYTRKQINDGILDGRGLEIAWLEDAVDLFFLQVQGSGRLRFTDGTSMRIGYAGKNGYKYSSVGRAMVRKGLTTAAKASADTIRDYVRANPQAGLDLLAENKSYIFFREARGLNPSIGPVGALGVQLHDQRSIAVDRRYTPLGAPVWLKTEGPQGPIRRLVVAHDTGSAIKGAQRADYFWGTGDAAGSAAGRMKGRGEMIVLLPNATVKRLTTAGS